MRDLWTIDRRRLMTTGLRLALVWPLAAAATACGGSSEEEGRSGGAGAAAPSEPAPAAEAPAQAPAAAPAETSAQAPAATGGALVTDIPENESLLGALAYVHESAKADQRCANCLLFTAGADGRGKCQLFAKGLVKETGWCSSWAARG